MNISDHPLFVWPFILGMVFLLLYLPLVYLKWLENTSFRDWKVLLRNLFSLKTLVAVKEVISECLLHRRIFKFNPKLGYMHMSLAFGWFLLIVVGKFETMVFTKDGFNAPYLPIFFKYFYPDGIPSTFKGVFFLTVMDLLLLFILSGLFLAFVKRFRSGILGMKKTTRHIPADKFALTFLWFIFPFRWLAESVTAGIHDTGGFFTLGSGKLLASFLPLEVLFLPSWWAYSIALGGFFIFLPFSRYMHIFTEVAMIFLKHWGLKREDRENGYTDFEVNACSRCGICTNVCQLSEVAGIDHIQAVYFLRDLRYGQPARDVAENCLLCGRCSQVCPVGIGVDNLRLKQRRQEANMAALPFPWQLNARISDRPVEVLYFAGCMTHLTPGILSSVKEILSFAGITFTVLDENGGICCGRPAMQAGFADQANNIISRVTELINKSDASLLLVSCPICYKVFNEDYNLSIPVEHHTLFFRNLMTSKPWMFRKSSLRMSYHDPCDLGRGSGIYTPPREIISELGTLLPVTHENEDSLCCGGSLGNLAVTPGQRMLITDHAYDNLAAGSPDYIVTSCPLCKKTFSKGNRKVAVIDIAEAVNLSLKSTISERVEKESVMETEYL